METYIAASYWYDDVDEPRIEKIEARNLEEAEFIFLKGFYFDKYFIKEDENATLEDLKEATPDTFSYVIKNIMDL